MDINILGTADDPLFQASQIGKLLGSVNIREYFNEDERDAVSSTDAIGCVWRRCRSPS
jgi:hypothetical protein